MDTRITPEQKRRYERAALLGFFSSLTEFVTAAADKEAEKIIREHEVMDIKSKDREFFIDMLLNPPAPNERLRQAAIHYQETLG